MHKNSKRATASSQSPGTATHPQTQERFKKEQRNGSWLPKEQERFVEAIGKYGNSWKEVAEHVGSRTARQCCSHAQKHFKQIVKSRIKELKENPETKNYMFAVVKHYYNTMLVQKKHFLSYQPNDRALKIGREKESKQEKKEEVKHKIDGSEEIDREMINPNPLKESIRSGGFQKETPTSEVACQVQMDMENPNIIYFPIVWNPVQSFPISFICPPHYNHFDKDVCTVNKYM
eukprot:TRINITY_DN3562_c0_g2_i11.p1 TRINITY_DN3562_c0_g2~~TRINITY_DN3562_c0_g2_i11.p1  ORF type:complete len:232 (-),score=25.58 TRINITY_DN3562_c0_g2_i11:150-845(-)